MLNFNPISENGNNRVRSENGISILKAKKELNPILKFNPFYECNLFLPSS